MTAGRIDVQYNPSRVGLSPPGLTFDGDWIMKKLMLLATAAAMTGSVISVAQMPPAPPAPPVPPGATVVMEAPNGERREMRRIIIRGDEVGTRGMGLAGGMGMGMGMGAMGAIGSFLDTRSVESMTRGLDLTPQQLGKMTEYVATARPEMRKLAEAMSAESRRLRELSPGDAKYAATSAEIAKRVGDLTGRLVEQNSALRAKVWGLLTPEQRIKAEIRAKEMRERAQERVRDLMKDRRFRGDGAERPSLMFFELERDEV
jgi:Spy/CpxP family protein refolding chaperone